MRKIVLLALPLIFLSAQASAGPGCGDPQAQNCNPGYWDDTSGNHDVCRACTGNTIANGCTRSCNACGSGTMSNAAHTACITPSPCPTIKGSQIPSNNWSATSSRPGYYAPDSAIINVGNGHVATSGASYSAVKSSMGGGFAGANFSVVSGPGGGGGLGPGVIQCPYDGPRYHNGGQILQATVTINCTGTCAGL